MRCWVTCMIACMIYLHSVVVLVAQADMTGADHVEMSDYSSAHLAGLADEEIENVVVIHIPTASPVPPKPRKRATTVRTTLASPEKRRGNSDLFEDLIKSKTLDILRHENELEELDEIYDRVEDLEQRVKNDEKKNDVPAGKSANGVYSKNTKEINSIKKSSGTSTVGIVLVFLFCSTILGVTACLIFVGRPKKTTGSENSQQQTEELESILTSSPSQHTTPCASAPCAVAPCAAVPYAAVPCDCPSKTTNAWCQTTDLPVVEKKRSGQIKHTRRVYGAVSKYNTDDWIDRDKFSETIIRNTRLKMVPRSVSSNEEADDNEEVHIYTRSGVTDPFLDQICPPTSSSSSSDD